MGQGLGANLEALTDRQLEVAELVTQGKRNREIAAKLTKYRSRRERRPYPRFLNMTKPHTGTRFQLPKG